MLKNFSKFLLSALLIILTISSLTFCYATEAVTTSETAETTDAVTTSETEESSTTDEIHNGDLYLFDNDIVMDKIVDGNVFIFGGNVEITGQVNGNLFVFANTVNFNESYVVDSTYICANSVYFNGVCNNNLYVATNKLEMTFNAVVYRDVKAVSSNIICKAAIGRDADLLCNTLDMGEEEDIPLIYGNLRYTSNNEIEIPEGVMAQAGTVTYTKPTNINIETTAVSVTTLLMGIVTSIVTALVLYFIIRKFTPNFAKKISNQKFSAVQLLKAFVKGLITMIVISILSILLLITVVGANLGVILTLLFATLCFIAVPTLTISITNALRPALKIEKTSMFCLILVLISIVLHGITLIPFVGGILGIVIKLVGIGLLINIYIPHKELSEDEKAAKKAKKQEKIEAKLAKKQEKLESKDAKKQEKEDNL